MDQSQSSRQPDSQNPQPFSPYGQTPPPSETEQGSTPVAPPPSFVTQTAGDDAKYTRSGWSWGAFMFGPVFLIAIRRYAYLWLYLLPGALMLGTGILRSIYVALLIIGIGALSFFVIPIYLGMKGRTLAAASRAFSNRDQYVGFMKGIDHAGKVLFFAFIVIMLLGMLVGFWAQSLLIEPEPIPYF